MEFKMRKNREYVVALEEERKKIQVFQRELPLCFELVTRAIEAYRKEISETTSDCTDQTSSGTPVLEEFIPLRRSSQVEEDDRSSNKNCKKSDWLRSAQLWNQPSDPSPKKPDVPKIAECGNGAFQPFHRTKEVTVKNDALCAATPARSSTGETVASGGSEDRKDEKEIASQRKQRRCWSSELHRRFLLALQQLGGSHAATPKQIRELMKVDGLTNDEVKSHLQKYRLHTRRPTPAIQARTSQSAQFVVVGGIWVPPPDFAAVEPANEIYAPVATPPPLSKAAASVLEKKVDMEPHVSGRSTSEGEAGHGGLSTSTASSHRIASSTVH